jgi:hypothetical protein
LLGVNAPFRDSTILSAYFRSKALRANFIGLGAWWSASLACITPPILKLLVMAGEKCERIMADKVRNVQVGTAAVEGEEKIAIKRRVNSPLRRTVNYRVGLFIRVPE